MATAEWLGACWSPVRFDITGAAGRLLQKAVSPLANVDGNQQSGFDRSNNQRLDGAKTL